ncbi:MAG: LysM peptidoglycan-binding domain-containing protein [Chloroflexota bacterium]|nr:LysM peptidoglycan-binding domain-containing protein [Anaerolineales bacterium]MCA9977203.1 LysM peptidoglycan-binding domain-containing protein [Anaerolineales bacterium]MCB8967245.1 LysM peptidoglycan-binding domain-containing protein [Ardenticatenaceae bacterium]
MANTRSNLTAARIVEIDENDNEVSGNEVPCMFNPYEYTVSKTNTYSEEPNNGSSSPEVEFQKSGAQTLRLNLTFDTYETGEDVSQITNKLWKFMEPGEEGGGEDKKPPPEVAFIWGVFRFVAVITAMTQRFTLFKEDGTPVRAKVEVTFTQHKDVNDYPNQNPTSGGGPVQRLHTIVSGDRLDTIAAKVYGDATRWRAIAEYNQIRDPLKLKAGQRLTIPQL